MRVVVLVLFSLLHFLFAVQLDFGVVPQQSPSVMIKKWQPIADYISKKSSDEVVLHIEKSIVEFEKKLHEGFYDFAYMNPYHYVVENKFQGYNARIRAKMTLQGILVAREEVNFRSKDINKKLFLFPTSLSFAATLLIKYELKKYYKLDIDKNVKQIYVNSHDSVYKGVARGIGDIGGGIERTLNNLNDEKSKAQ